MRDKRISENHNFEETVLKRANAYRKRLQRLKSESYVFDRISYRVAQILSYQLEVIRKKWWRSPVEKKRSLCCDWVSKNCG